MRWYRCSGSCQGSEFFVLLRSLQANSGDNLLAYTSFCSQQSSERSIQGFACLFQLLICSRWLIPGYRFGRICYSDYCFQSVIGMRGCCRLCVSDGVCLPSFWRHEKWLQTLSQSCQWYWRRSHVTFLQLTRRQMSLTSFFCPRLIETVSIW